MKKKLAFVVATPMTYNAFLKGHANALMDEYDVTLIADFANWAGVPLQDGVKTLHVPIRRKVSVLSDCVAFLRLWRVLRAGRYDIVHSVTPKAGLLANMAGRAAGIEVRIHTFTGQVWATQTGVSRALLKAFDKLTLECATLALSDSPSQAAFLRSEGFTKSIHVLGDGAISGIDTERFRPNSVHRAAVRAKFGLAIDDLVFLFLGRLTRDKGILDLVEGFSKAALGPKCKLLIVGPDEEGLAPKISQHPLTIEGRIVLTGETTTPERFLSAGDVFCLPSYREGFGSSVLEAAAVGLPSIVSRIYGLTDAVIEGETGIMHEVGNSDQIAACLTKVARDADLRARMASAAHARVLITFPSERITTELRNFYATALTNASQTFGR